MMKSWLRKGPGMMIESTELAMQVQELWAEVWWWTVTVLLCLTPVFYKKWVSR